jgi:hypothetical protein
MKRFSGGSTYRQMGTTTDDDIYRRYLLGQLEDPARTSLEERLFAGDDALTPDLAVAEHDVIDDYVRDRLAPEERRPFELTLQGVPSRRRKVALAAALARHSGENRRRPNIPQMRA